MALSYSTVEADGPMTKASLGRWLDFYFSEKLENVKGGPWFWWVRRLCRWNERGGFACWPLRQSARACALWVPTTS